MMVNNVRTSQVTWRTPLIYALKINVDVASRYARIGVAVRNGRGELMGALTWHMEGCTTMLTSELIAIPEAVFFCHQCGFFQGKIVSDYLVAINILVDSHTSLVPNCFVMEQFQSLLKAHPSFKCVFEFGKANKATHRVANYATTLESFESWLPFVLQDDVCTSIIS